jgi:hypothetical protein
VVGRDLDLDQTQAFWRDRHSFARSVRLSIGHLRLQHKIEALIRTRLVPP